MTDWKREYRPLIAMIAVFIAAYYLPVGDARFANAVSEAFHLLREYARLHVLTCLVPAFFIAGAISVFVSKESVMKYLGPKASKPLAYGVASVAGTVLAVCSCTVLPLFAGIYRMGAGLGPATAFLYSGPAINVLAIILTARVLGVQIGAARAVGAVVFSIVIGLLMYFFFRKEDQKKAAALAKLPVVEPARPLWQTSLYFASMVAILVFANWGAADESQGFWYRVYSIKWLLTGLSALALGCILAAWFSVRLWKVAAVAAAVIVSALTFRHQPLVPFSVAIVGLSLMTSTDNGEMGEWFASTWTFAKQIFPLLFAGVLVSGFLLGRPGHEGLIPSAWVEAAVGGNSLRANIFSSIAAAFMYFATLTEVPILQGLIGSGMGKGPALAMLLAGPAVSLPSMLVIASIMGTRKTMVYVALVVLLSSFVGLLFGSLSV